MTAATNDATNTSLYWVITWKLLFDGEGMIALGMIVFLIEEDWKLCQFQYVTNINLIITLMMISEKPTNTS